ncbi:MAG: glycosyltransferase family 2 protein [Pseudomonadales bacterium]|nr:glycosyltransferase family 2 protein [Pseudomonadales bacterium]
MKPSLIVTIPAYNEEATLPSVIKSIPKTLKGVGKIEVLVWSDGSTDNTIKAAKKAGATHVFENKKNVGLAKTFDRATKKAVEIGADIIVNTDADNQYDQSEIPLLLQPILEQGADMVNGDRQVEKLEHMPLAKKYGNMLGSWTIRWLTGVHLNDASSGFRAYTKEAIESFDLLSSHTYTHETIIQAAFKDLLIHEVPVTFKKRHGSGSKLISSVWSHIKKSGATIVRTILMYRAFKVLSMIGLTLCLIGCLFMLRFLYFYLTDAGSGHVQSLIFASVLISMGFNTIMLGVIADLIAVNRKLLEKKVSTE